MILKSFTSFCKNCLGVLKDSNHFQSSTMKSRSLDEVDNPICITIHKPIYEYAHGKKFKAAPTWIVVHYTACINIGAKAMCKVMKSNTSASSHFYIDDDEIYQSVPLEYIAWHVGDGKCKQPELYNRLSLEELSKYLARDWRYDLSANSHLQWKKEGNDFIGNSVSIGVDICVCKKSSSTRKATDTDWYFKDEAIENAAKTVAYLAKKYNIDDSRIITHCMATGKLCPQPFVWPPKIGDKKWAEFKDKVKEYRKHDIVATFI